MSDTENIDTAPETASDPGAEVKAAALAQLGKAEDITAYVAEYKDQEAEAAGEKPATPPEARMDRYRAALEEARQETDQARKEVGLNGDQPGGFDQQYDAAHADYEAEQGRQAELAEAEKRGADLATYKMRAAQALNEHPDYWQAVQSTFSVIPPTQEIAQQLLEAEEGPEMVWRMTQMPDTIEQLNAMPPKEAEKFLHTLNGHIMAEKAMARRFAANPQPAE